MGLDPAVAEVRSAVRAATADLAGTGALVLAACSGGADSLALSAAIAWSGPRDGLRVGVVHVDHGLQPGSERWAAQVGRWATGFGVDTVELLEVAVTGRGGPEAAARTARYRALQETAGRLDAAAVLLGHTLDDQAETVLLGLARGSGARSLAGMAAVRGRYRRPLLEVPRATTRAACRALGLRPIADPANSDLGSTRVRVRRRALPALEASLGPGVAAALARSARLLRADADALDALASTAYDAARPDQPARPDRPDRPDRPAAPGDPRETDPGPGAPRIELDVAVLAALLPAVRSRVLHRAARAAGVPGGALIAAHVSALDALVTDWHGQGAVALPGGVVGLRRSGRLHLQAGPITPGPGLTLDLPPPDQE